MNKGKIELTLSQINEIVSSGQITEIERDHLLHMLRELYCEVKFCDLEGYSSEGGINKNNISLADEFAHAPLLAGEPDLTDGEISTDNSVDEVEAEAESKPERRALLSLYDDDPVDSEPALDVRTTQVLDNLSESEFPSTLPIENDLAAVNGETIAMPGSTGAKLLDTVSLNERMLILNELFNGDQPLFEAVIGKLDSFDDLDSVLLYIHEELRWNPNNEGAKLLVDLLVRKLA